MKRIALLAAFLAAPVAASPSAPSPERQVDALFAPWNRPGMPGAVGLKLARPDQPVVGVVSDGSAMYSITALWTAAHHKVPVTWVICNNASYRILKLNLMEYLGPENDRLFMHTDIVDPAIRYDRLAESLGVKGWRVEKPEELRPALESALALGEPALVDVSIQGRVR